jgi:cholesterol oxidase
VTVYPELGHENLYGRGGSMISANPGENPSLTITAMAEEAMSWIPSKDRIPYA